MSTQHRHSAAVTYAVHIHWRRSRGTEGTRPPEFGVGDDNANCPPQILSYKYKKELSLAFKIRQNAFSAAGELTTLPQTT